MIKRFIIVMVVANVLVWSIAIYLMHLKNKVATKYDAEKIGIDTDRLPNSCDGLPYGSLMIRNDTIFICP